MPFRRSLFDSACDTACITICISPPEVVTVPRHSLAKNQLCGVDEYRNGTFTLVAIEKLCELLPSTSISTLKCAICHYLDTAGITFDM